MTRIRRALTHYALVVLDGVMRTTPPVGHRWPTDPGPSLAAPTRRRTGPTSSSPVRAGDEAHT